MIMAVVVTLIVMVIVMMDTKYNFKVVSKYAAVSIRET